MGKISFIFAASVIEVIADQISCPELLCEDPDPDLPSRADLCYLHDGNQPAKILRAHSCSWYSDNSKTLIEASERICEFNLNSGKYAWMNEDY